MKRTIIGIALLFSFVTIGSAQKSLETDLMKMEKAAWDAFGKGDGRFFETFLTDGALVFSGTRFSGRADLVRDISTKPCELRSYEFSNFKVTMLNSNTALVTYEVTQDATCGGNREPAKVGASSVYVKTKGKWLAAFHQESPVVGM